jgi:hypothetical protein
VIQKAEGEKKKKSEKNYGMELTAALERAKAILVCSSGSETHGIRVMNEGL